MSGQKTKTPTKKTTSKSRKPSQRQNNYSTKQIHNIQNNKPLFVFITLIIIIGIIGFAIFKKGNHNPSTTNNTNTTRTSNSTQHPIQTKSPTDKYTYYIKDYVGRNASDTCEWRLDESCKDDYGDGALQIVFITSDGQKIDETNISYYKVTSQNIEPNTEIKISYSDSEESRLFAQTNPSEITLHVEVIDANKKVTRHTERKTGQLKRYECEYNDNSEVIRTISENENNIDSLDTVECSWDETTSSLE